jgi:phosphate-selective porin OprO and OprP
MKFSKLTLAIAATLGVSASFNAVALDLYVDTKTKQLFAEPGRGRVLLGAYEKVVESSSTPGTSHSATPAPAATSAEVAAIKQDLELKTNAIKALEEHAEEESKPSSVHVKLDDGIHFATKDGNFTAGINGRLQIDSQSNINQHLPGLYGNYVSATGAPATLNDGATLRRARLGVEGTFFKNTDYKFEYDFTRGNGLNAGGITDAFVRYNFSSPFSIKAGAFKEPFSIEEATSNRYLTFIERNMAVNTFVDNLNTYKVGLGLNYSADRWLVASSFQTEGIGGYNNAYGSNNKFDSTTTGSALGVNGGVNRNGGGGDTSWEVNTRVGGTPWMESKTKFLHVGASGSYISINNNYNANGTFNNGGVIFANGLGGNVDRSLILTTGNLSGAQGTVPRLQANNLKRFGGESALVYGPFSAQGEYIETDVSGHGYNQTSLSGYYGYVTYFLTGESRNYAAKTGSWGRIKPNQNFDMKGGKGAWELAAGYDYLNLHSGAINGGRASTGKFGLNWYPNSHVRVMANYIRALDINTSGMAAGSQSLAWNRGALDMFETRVQLDW